MVYEDKGMSGFYENYVKLMGNLIEPDRATPYKINYLKKIIKNDKVYKFISFEGDASLVRTKIETLKQGKIWFSFYKTLNDETEFYMNYNAKNISQITGRSINNVHLLVNYLTEMYDVYSLTYEYQNSMWQDYAAGGNGICIEYNVGDYDYLYPVEYLEKTDIDFEQMIISAITGKNLALAIIPWVIKNPVNITANMDSTKEKEVRMLYCPYDLAELNSGRVEMNIKERLHYRGIAKPYTDFKLSVSKIIIGNKCCYDTVKELEIFCDANGISYTYL